VTLRGKYMVTEAGAAAGNYVETAISFGFRLAADPVTHYIKAGAVAPAECPGTVTNPEAAPGHVCAYEASNLNAQATRAFCNPEVNGCGLGATLATQEGTAVYTYALAAGQVMLSGSWAVTAPAGAAAAAAPAPNSAGGTTASG
jgi:hypothetical protein